MTVDLDKLEALAKAATPGPWRRGHVKRDIVDDKYPRDGSDIHVETIGTCDLQDATDHRREACEGKTAAHRGRAR